MNIFRFSSVVWLALLCAVNSWADNRLNNPVGPDGYYIVKWDCENNTWASSNDVEYDETFVLAVDLTGTMYEGWVNNPQSRNGVNYPVENTIVSLNTFRGSKGGNMYKDNRARLWHIRDNIYGAMYNFAQFETEGGWTNTAPAIGEQTKIYARMFPSATLFSDRCYPISPTQKKGSIWDYQENWWAATDDQPLFVFQPYTGTKTGAAFTTQEMTPGTHIFYDNDHYVVGNGYAAPCSVNDDQCCPFFYPLDPVTQTVNVGTDMTLTAEERSGNLAGVTYQWYRYVTSAGETTAVPYTGTGAQTKTCHPATNEGETDYTYYCFIKTDNCPDGVYTTHAQVIVEKLCPEYTITVDGMEVSSAQTFYPGGWYVIGCTSTAGAPTTKQLPAGAKAHFGHDTLYIHTDAATAPLTIVFPTAETPQYAACSGMLTGLISQCGEDQAYVFKWDDNKGYVMDNNGVVQMSTTVNDNTADQWLALPTGDPQVLGKDVVYLYNLTTNRYLCHGPVQETDGGNMDYAAAITSPTLTNSDEYKWIFYQGDQQRIYIMNLSGWTDNWQQALVLHCRNWNYMYCDGNNNQYALRVCGEDMKVGKMVGYDVSGEMHTSLNNLITVTGTKAVLPATALGWNGTAPEAVVNMTAGQEITYTAVRTDNTHSVNKAITYSSSNPDVAFVDPATGKVTAGNSGTATITAKLEDAGCFEGAELTYQVKVQGCTAFTWSIDGEAGLSKLMYPGGWYMLSCTSDDGAPTITVNGIGVTTGAATTAGNTTTVRVTLNGNATGAITLRAVLQLSGMDCENTQTVTASECTETAAESRKIEWYNYNGSTTFPQYWIHDGAPVYLRDNNGFLEADIEHNDGNDQWYIIKTGEKCQGEDVFYLQNVQTMRYVYRGNRTGNAGGDWEYTEALLSATNDQTDAYKWIVYTYNNKTAVVNVGGFTGANFTNGAYMLHVRNWEAPDLFSNPNIPSPRMVCGKMASQDASPVFYYKAYTTTVPVTQFRTRITWQTTAPPAEIVANNVGQTFAFPVVRADDIHSINSAVTYISTNTAVATVDAATGKVTIVASSGECDILAVLEDVGCFKGDTLIYHVRLYDCTQDITSHTDYILPKQPKNSEDCSYIVLWDCDKDTWAMDNTMEWGETFVFAVNLAGTALGDWAMKPASDPSLERSVAFDRFLIKNDEGTQFNLDASRLWHIRDTIFGAEFNFAQIPYTNGSSYTPALGEQTGIAARLFGQETAKGAKCGAEGPSKTCNWWQWSNEGSLQSEFTGEWLVGSYVSNNDRYLFRFAPYTGKSDPVIKPADDDTRDQWYDNHYFTSVNGYRSPCPKDWPADQTLSGAPIYICLEKDETAEIRLDGSEPGWNYILYLNGSELSGSTRAGNGATLSWDNLGVGEYTVLAAATNEAAQHSDWMGDCSGIRKITVSAAVDCVEPEPCENLIYRKWNDLLFVDNSTQRFIAYQWFCDGKPIEGQTRQFLYYDGAVLSGNNKTYYCLMTLADGSTVKACPDTFDNFPPSVGADKQEQAPKVFKYIYDGRLFIRFGDKTFNALGARINH